MEGPRIHLEIYNQDSWNSEMLPPTMEINTMYDLKEAIQALYVPDWRLNEMVVVYLGSADEPDANEVIRADSMSLTKLIGEELKPKFEVYKKKSEEQINMIVIREVESNIAHTVNVTSQDTVSDLKVKIEELIRVSPDKQKLSYGGCLLCDGDILVNFVKGGGYEVEVDVINEED